MISKFKLVGTSLLFLSSSLLIASNSASKAERGSQFYKFVDVNSTKARTGNTSTNVKAGTSDIAKTLAELLKVAKQQRNIQQKIYNLLSNEFDPKPKKVIINGKECIENFSKDCFVMPLTRAAKKIPVLKAMLVHPTPETAKN